MKSIPPLPSSSSETPMRKRIRDRINLRASLIQIQVPTPPMAGQQQPPTSSSSTPTRSISNDTTHETPMSASSQAQTNDETIILREISLLASARKSQLSTSMTETNHSNSRILLAEKIKVIFEEENFILGSIDKKKLEQTSEQQLEHSRMKTEALCGFVTVMENCTRNELKRLKDTYKHLALFWITLARFEACHGHLDDALNLIHHGVETLKQDENHGSQEVHELLIAAQQIQQHYGQRDTLEDQLMVTPRKRKRRSTTSKDTESPVVTTPRRSPRFVKSPK